MTPLNVAMTGSQIILLAVVAWALLRMTGAVRELREVAQWLRVGLDDISSLLARLTGRVRTLESQWPRS